jgi:hypothetical protein
MIVPKTNNIDNIENKKFTIQYTKEELDMITLNFVTQMSKYIARVNNRIIKTLEEIEKEAEVMVVEIFLPPTSTSSTTSTRNY